MPAPTRRKPRAPATPQPTELRPRIKLWLDAGDETVFCSGLCAILRGVEKTGSIKDAATHVGRSYRFVWSRIKQAEQRIGATLVTTHVGGSGTQRSELTPLAIDLLRDFEALRSAVWTVVEGVFAEQLTATLRRHIPAPPST